MADVTWTNSDSDGDLSNPNNWDTLSVPTSGDTAHIPSGNGPVTAGSLSCDSAVIGVYVQGGEFHCPVSIDMTDTNPKIQGGEFFELVSVSSGGDSGGIQGGTFHKGIYFDRTSTSVYGTDATWPDEANVNANANPYGPNGDDYNGTLECSKIMNTAGGAGGCIPTSAVTTEYGGDIPLDAIAGPYGGTLALAYILTTSPIGGDYTPPDASIVKAGEGFGDDETGSYDPMAAAVFPDQANVNANALPYGPTGTEFYGEISCGELLNTVGGAGGCYVPVDPADVRDGVDFGNSQTGTYAPLAAAVWPAENLVMDTAPTYGPTGTEYTASLSVEHVLLAGGGLYETVAQADVKVGVNYGVDNALAGYCYLPDAGSVLEGVHFGSNTELSGTVTLPTTGQVLTGIHFGPDNASIGTVTLPTTGQVKASTNYGANGTQFTGTRTDPTNNRVLAGITFGDPAAPATGTLVVPTAAQVLSGVSFGGNGNQFTGTVVLPIAGNVRSGVNYGPSSNTAGTITLPDASLVAWGEQFGAGGTEFTGSWDSVAIINPGNVISGGGDGRAPTVGTLTLPDAADVRLGVVYGVGGNPDTGNVRVPAADKVKAGYQYDAADTVTGTYHEISTPSPDTVGAYLDAATGSVVSYQLRGVDDEPDLAAIGLDDNIHTITVDGGGRANIAMVRGGYYRYWLNNGRYRTVHITETTPDPYALPEVTG